MRFSKFVPPAVILAVFSIDRLTKSFIQKNLEFGDSISVFPFFNLTYITNTGIAFGMGHHLNGFFTLVSLVLLIVLVGILRFWEKQGSVFGLKFALSLVIGGAVGNLYDRIALGNVIDFLDFFAGATHWPAFNIADSSICIGAGTLAVLQWRSKKAAQK